MTTAQTVMELIAWQAAQMCKANIVPVFITIGRAEDQLLLEAMRRTDDFLTAFRLSNVTTCAGSTMFGLTIRVDGTTGVRVA